MKMKRRLLPYALDPKEAYMLWEDSAITITQLTVKCYMMHHIPVCVKEVSI
jgi:hypothetical protein